ncbi:MAG: hypothetical protein ABF633_02835 [Clostridium sp.]|uniref:hypothetical protein n=1 Tax=Clostridium sp. TaxID=1506 RepID=UPI0039E8F8FA
MGFWDDVKKERKKYTFGAMAQKEKDKQDAKKAEKEYQKERLEQLKKDHVPFCPKCKSTNIHAEKRGWKLMTGFIGSSKIIITCLNCGHKWKP